MSPEYVRALMMNAGPAGPMQTKGRAYWNGDRLILPEDDEKNKSKKGSGSMGKNPLSAWISELSGAGGASAGAAGGAAIGAAFGGVGAIPGAIIGGALGGLTGGFGGKAIEQKVRDDQNLTGAGGSFRSALGEGALSGVLGGVGPAFQGARGLSALGKASGSTGIRGGIGAIGSMSDDAAKVAGKAIAKGGAKAGRAIGQGLTGESLDYATQKGLQSLGTKGRSWNRGIVAGNKGLSPDDARNYNIALDNANKWLSGVSKSSQYTNADDALKALSNQYKKAPEAVKAFGKKNADDLATRFLENIDANPTLRETLKGKNAKIVENLLDDALSFGKKNNGDFVDFMAKKINPRYRTISSGGSAGSVESQVLEAFRDAGKSVIDESLTSRSGVNKQMSNLLGASKQLSQTITRDVGAGSSQGATLGRIAQNVLGPAADVGGRAAQTAGAVTKYTTPIAGGATLRGVLNSAAAPMEQPEQLPQEAPDALVGPAYGQELQGGTQGLAGGMNAPQSNSPFDPANAQSAISQILAQGGDFGDVQDYLKIVDAMQGLSGGGGGTAQERKVAQQQQTAMQGLSQLESLFSNAGGGQNRLPGIFGNVQGKLGGNSEAEAYNRIRDSLTTSLARAFGETGVLTDQDREVYRQALPRLEDTPEEAAIKLQYLRDMLSSGQPQTNQYSLQGAF